MPVSEPEFGHQMAYADSGPEPSSGSIGSYLRAIRRHAAVVVCVALAALVGSLVWAAVRSRTYQATAQILVTPIEPGDATGAGLPVLHDSSDPAVTMETAAALVDSDSAADLAARRLGGHWSPKAVTSAVSVLPRGGSNLLDVTATAADGGTAAHVADAFAQASLDVRRLALEQQVRASISALRTRLAAAKAGSPESRSISGRISTLSSELGVPDPTLSLAERAPAGIANGPAAATVVPLSLLGGIVLGCVAAILLELATMSVRDEADLATVYPLPILARVPGLRRREIPWRRGGGLLVRDGLPLLSDGRSLRPGKRPGALSTAGADVAPRSGAAKAAGNGDRGWSIPPIAGEAFRALLLQLETTGEHAQVVMIASPGSDDGRTETAINLAATAAAAGHRAVLLDLDLYHAGVARRLGLARQHGAAELSDPDVELDDLLEPVPGLPGLRVLPTRRFAVAQLRELGLLERAVRGLPSLIRRAAEDGELVVVDAPPLGEVSDALRMLPAVDDLVLVARVRHTQRQALVEVRELLQRSGRVPTGIVLFEADALAEPSWNGNDSPAREPSERRPARILDS